MPNLSIAASPNVPTLFNRSCPSTSGQWSWGGYATDAQARMEAFKYIEMVHNRTRRHAALDYLSPVEYERHYEAGQLIPMEPAALCWRFPRPPSVGQVNI